MALRKDDTQNREAFHIFEKKNIAMRVRSVVSRNENTHTHITTESLTKNIPML
jgi:hypothetical protein